MKGLVSWWGGGKEPTVSGLPGPAGGKPGPAAELRGGRELGSRTM